MIKPDKHITGIGFWIGGAVFSVINIIKIHTHANSLRYDYIMTAIAVIFVILSLILLRKRNKKGDLGTNVKNNYAWGIGFWAGGGVYSLINMIMNLKSTPQGDILMYNYFIAGVAVIGLILNIILLKREK